MLGLLKRTIVHKDPYILVTLYKSLVRSHLEYCVLRGHRIIWRIKNVMKEFSTDSLGCLKSSKIWTTMLDYVNWDFGRWKSGGIELI